MTWAGPQGLKGQPGYEVLGPTDVNFAFFSSPQCARGTITARCARGKPTSRSFHTESDTSAAQEAGKNLSPVIAFRLGFVAPAGSWTAMTGVAAGSSGMAEALPREASGLTQPRSLPTTCPNSQLAPNFLSQLPRHLLTQTLHSASGILTPQKPANSFTPGRACTTTVCCFFFRALSRDRSQAGNLQNRSCEGCGKDRACWVVATATKHSKEPKFEPYP